MRLRDPYAEDPEPSLELRMKIRRRTGVNGIRGGCVRAHQLGWYRRAFGPLQGAKALFA